MKVASTQGCSTQAADGVAAKDDTRTSFSSHIDMGYGQETDLEQLNQEYFSTSQRQTISSLSTWIRDTESGWYPLCWCHTKEGQPPPISPLYPSQEITNRIYSHLQINSNSHLRMNHQKGTSATKMRKYLKSCRNNE